MSLNKDEKKKVDGIITRIAVILFLGFLGIQAWRNAADIAFGEPFPELRQNVEQTRQEADRLQKTFDDIDKREREERERETR